MSAPVLSSPEAPRLDAQRPAPEPPRPRRPSALGLVLRAQARVLQAERSDDAAQQFIALLVQEFALDSAVLALRRGARLRDPVAGAATALRLGPAERDAALTALHEALDQDRPVLWPPVSSARAPAQAQAETLGPITAAHRQWLGPQGRSAASLPWHDPPSLQAPQAAAGSAWGQEAPTSPPKPRGVLCALRGPGQPQLDAAERAALQDLIAFVGPVLALRARAERGWLRQAARTWRDRAPAALQAPRRVAAVGLALLALVLLLPLPQHVTAPARIEAEVQRTLVAPESGFLHKAHVRAGDRVKAGQVLVELADEELQLERQRLLGVLEQSEGALAEANARADRTQLVIESARAQEARAQLDLVQVRLARARVVAPFDGTVLRGDLSLQLGAPLAAGAELLTLAPDGDWRVIAEVDERDIARIAAGQAAELQLSALPWDTLPATLTLVSPMARPGAGGNVFEVQGRLTPVAQAPLRAGHSGQLRVAVGRGPWLAHLLDKAAAPLRRLGWWLWG